MNKVYVRPKVGDVKVWDTLYDSELVKVEVAAEPWCDLYKVTASGKRPKYYFGELAWADARRYAGDIDYGAWSIY